jgi:Ni2+-binding GTPase involved in maturation of urease and hydrogenase
MRERLQTVVILRDLTSLHQKARLEEQNKLINLLSSSCNHEMLAPIHCIISMVSELRRKARDSEEFCLTVIYNTAYFLLSQVQSNLDSSLLEANKLKLNNERLALI